MNRDLQERGLECLVEHHDIESVSVGYFSDT
jgi:hypothetical protein